MFKFKISDFPGNYTIYRNSVDEKEKLEAEKTAAKKPVSQKPKAAQNEIVFLKLEC